MSLNLNKLEKVRELAGGIVQARCPACAEGGNDRAGEHLRVFPDGRFGCCVHPKDGEHRKRIFALTGIRERQTIRVKVAAPPVSKIIQADVLGRLGRVFCSLAQPTANITTEAGTLGTGQYIYRCEKKNTETDNSNNSIEKLKEFRPCVPTVPAVEVRLESEIPVPSVPTPCGGPPLPTATGEKLPFLTAGGTLSIPFDSPERYHWWKPDGERLTVAETLAEVKERMKNAVTI